MIKILKSLIFLSVLWVSLPIFASAASTKSLNYFRPVQTTAQWNALAISLKQINETVSQLQQKKACKYEIKEYNDAQHNDAIRTILKEFFGLLSLNRKC